MIRKVALVVVLLAAGVAIALYVRRGSGTGEEAVAFTPQTGATADVRIADLDRPREGLLRANQQPLLDLQRSLAR